MQLYNCILYGTTIHGLPPVYALSKCMDLSPIGLFSCAFQNIWTFSYRPLPIPFKIYGLISYRPLFLCLSKYLGVPSLLVTFPCFVFLRTGNSSSSGHILLDVWFLKSRLVILCEIPRFFSLYYQCIQ